MNRFEKATEWLDEVWFFDGKPIKTVQYESYVAGYNQAETDFKAEIALLKSLAASKPEGDEK